MAEGKKGFILYADLIHTVSQLSDVKAGKLLKHILKYVNDENPECNDQIINLVFTPIKHQLKRDLNHWEDVRQQRSLAGKASAEARRKKKQNSTNLTNVKSVQQKLTKSTVIVNVNDNVNVKVKDNDIINAFKKNVIETAKDNSISNTIVKEFLDHWTERDYEHKCFAWQVPETFIIKSRLKG